MLGPLDITLQTRPFLWSCRRGIKVRMKVKIGCMAFMAFTALTTYAIPTATDRQAVHLLSLLRHGASITGLACSLTRVKLSGLQRSIAAYRWPISGWGQTYVKVSTVCAHLPLEWRVVLLRLWTANALDVRDFYITRHTRISGSATHTKYPFIENYMGSLYRCNFVLEWHT